MNRTTVGSRPRRPARLRLGVGMIVASLVGALFAGLAAPASAAEPDLKVLKLAKTAYWTRSLGHMAPNVLFSRFPPQAVCLVVPEFCGEQAEQVTDNEAFSLNKTVQANQPADHIPNNAGGELMVAPDTFPTAVIAGARRYQSAMKFPVPALGENEEFSTFELVLKETTPTYHFDSPAFRQFMTGALALARRDHTEIPKTLDHEPATDVHLGIEACPIVVTWEGGDNQDAAKAPDRDTYEREGNKTLEPQIDCGYGANGERQSDGTWKFDLSAAANAWASGELPNEGVLLRPVNPPNLAYGDPDLSTWDQVSFVRAGEGAPAALIDVEELPPLPSFPDFPSPASDNTAVLGSTAQAGTMTEVFGSPANTPADVPAPPPPAPEQSGGLVAAPAGLSSPVTEWWVWMILPLLLGGMYLVSQGLTAEVAVAQERAGAMTRLLAQRRAQELEV